MNISIPESIEAALKNNAPVAIGVSGGKDSCAVAIAVSQHLKSIGHTGPKVLVHSDLGSVEWKDSLPTCERLSKHIGYPLTIVRRQAGDMLDRWKQRWANNLERYINLECVKLILPWSTPSMRFCTSELKSAVIASELKKQFPKQQILSVTGIRADESANRAKAPICQVNIRLSRKDGTSGMDWHPIHQWPTPFIYEYLKQQNFPLHEAYTKYGSTRVSCVACIMSSANDLIAATNCLDNHAVYRDMVDLEITSTFSFQGSKWLADVAPHFLTEKQRGALVIAKEKAQERTELEKLIPKHLLYTKGWPLCIPSLEEATILASIRSKVGAMLNITPMYPTPTELIARFIELFDEGQTKQPSICNIIETPKKLVQANFEFAA